MKVDDRTPLRRAVDRLIADNKIKQDKDLQEIFSLSKSTISAYLNNPKPGKRFVNEFEKKFGISLNEFETPTNDDKAKIAALESKVTELRLNAIEANLNELLSHQKVLMAMVQVAMNNAIDFYAGKSPAKVAELKSKTKKAIASEMGLGS